MTAHIILTTLSIICMLLGIIQHTKGKKSFWMIFLSIFLLLPMTFGGMTVISHFLFVATPKISIVYLITMPLLILYIAYLLWKKRNKFNPRQMSLLLILLALYIFWYVYSLLYSTQEPDGPTPKLFYHNNTTLYWGSLWVVTLISITYLFITKSVDTFLKKTFLFVFIIILSLILFTSLYGGKIF